MCDTAVALTHVTKDHCVYFAKNSDREPNEAQYLQIVPGSDHTLGETVRCTYIDIPQIAKTYTVLLSKPKWMWGAEMGVNENGVAIGNEAVFTRLKAGKEPGLIGMDFLRLALERSASAEEALHIIVDLLKEYGQSGNCSAHHQLYYHNSFLIADRQSAWVLETAGKQWAALKVKDYYSISNKISIGNQWDLASDDLVRLAIDKGWCKGKEDFHFANCYSDLIYSTFSQGQQRRSCSYEFLGRHSGEIDTRKMMAMLRQHNADDENWSPDRSLTEWTLCVHKGFGPIRASQTVGSLICRLDKKGDTYFATGTSAPCLSTFKPIWLDSGLPDSLDTQPGDTFDAESLWWQHELFHREILKDFDHRKKMFESERDQIEDTWLVELESFGRKDGKARKLKTKEILQKEKDLRDKWLHRMQSEDIKRKNIFYYDWEWRKNNREAKISL
jgi:secernin